MDVSTFWKITHATVLRPNSMLCVSVFSSKFMEQFRTSLQHRSQKMEKLKTRTNSSCVKICIHEELLSLIAIKNAAICMRQTFWCVAAPGLLDFRYDS